ncbi:MAG: hypothetical protein AB1Y36_09285 [Cycloclasticus sp.]
MSIIKKTLPNAALSRTIAAIIGGYLLANLLSILLSYLMPGSQADAVLTSMLLSFLIYTGVVIWVFAVRTIRQVWTGILLSCLICTVLTIFVAPEGLL